MRRSRWLLSKWRRRTGLAWPPERFDVDLPKIVEYLLNDAHPKGDSKSRFLKGFGFVLEEPRTLAASLIEHGQTRQVARRQVDEWGTRYEVEGAFRTPSGQTPRLLTVWIIRTGEQHARFVTALPLPKT